MNIAQIYADCTQVLTEETIVRQAATDLELSTNKALAQQAKAQWLAAHGTAEFLRELDEQAKHFDEIARNCAITYHITKNHDTIVGALIQAQAIRNIIVYARSN